MLLSSALVSALQAATTELSVAGAAATSWEKVRRTDANLASFMFVLVGFLKRLSVEQVRASFSVPCNSDRILPLYCVVTKGIYPTSAPNSVIP